MDYGRSVLPTTFSEPKSCELCGDMFKPSNSRGARLCPNCQSIEKDIRAVIGDKSYKAVTPEEKEQIMFRASRNRTVSHGPYHYR